MKRNAKIILGLSALGAVSIFGYRHFVSIPKEKKEADEQKLKEVQSNDLAKAIGKKIFDQYKNDNKEYGALTPQGSKLTQAWLTQLATMGYKYSNGVVTKK